MSDTCLEPLIEFGAMPFTISASDIPHNPAPFPDILPLRLGLDRRTGLVRQRPDSEIGRYLKLAYDAGSLLGTAMDDTPLGRAYAKDFLEFLRVLAPLFGTSVLEIGAGRGFFLRLLRSEGADVLGVEPGRTNAGHWARYRVPVIDDFFPTRRIDRAFDAVIGFSVLEHIEDLDCFLAAVRCQIASNGLAVFAVPDCSDYIAQGDPGMLLHEHWNYFTASTLANVVRNAGFRIRRLDSAGYGSVLYVAATPDPAPPPADTLDRDLSTARDFAARCTRLRNAVGPHLRHLAEVGQSVGIYVPGRALMWIEPGAKVRFFDDDPELHGRYYPPFDMPVESRDQLLSHPVDELWIMSKSFGGAIADQLKSERTMRCTRCILVDQLVRRLAGGSRPGPIS